MAQGLLNTTFRLTPFTNTAIFSHANTSHAVDVNIYNPGPYNARFQLYVVPGAIGALTEQHKICDEDLYIDGRATWTRLILDAGQTLVASTSSNTVNFSVIGTE